MQWLIWVLAVCGAVGVLLWRVPKWQTRDIGDTVQRIQIENELRRTIAQILGGLVVLVGLFTAWDTLQSTRRSLDLAQDRQLTERFATAVQQLGSEHLSLRIGALFSLERVASESERDREPVGRVLAAFIRDAARWHGGEPRRAFDVAKNEDIQAALLILGRQRWPSTFRLDLRGVDMVRADLSDGRFTNAFFQGSFLEYGIMTKANLEGAYIFSTQMPRASLYRANLRSIHGKGVNFTAAFLQEADLSNADLRMAVLRETRLTGAILDGADLRKADLSTSIGLTQQQLDRTCTDHDTLLPQGLDRPPPCVGVEDELGVLHPN